MRLHLLSNEERVLLMRACVDLHRRTCRTTNSINRLFQTFVHCDPQVKHSRRMWLTPTYRLLFGFFQIRSGMGACAGTIRRCVRFLPVLQGSRSGHPPGRCLVHPQLLEMPINLMQPQGRWSTRWPPPLTRVPCFPSGEQDQHHENEPHVRAAAADTHGLYR